MPDIGLTSVFPPPKLCAPYSGLPVRHAPVKVCDILRLTCAPCPGFRISVPFPSITPSYWDWSPVENRLAILDKKMGLVIGDPFSGEVESLSRPDVRMFAWAPDGKALAFEENGDIYVFNLETNDINNLTVDLGTEVTLAENQWIKIPVAWVDPQR